MMNFEYPFSVSHEEARTRLHALGEYLTNRHGIRVTWPSEDKAKFAGKYMVVTIDGEMTLGKGAVQVSAKDPGMLWRKKAMSYLQEKLAIYLDPATPVDKLPRGK